MPECLQKRLRRSRAEYEEALCKFRHARIDEHISCLSCLGVEQKLVLDQENPAVSVIQTNRIASAIIVTDQQIVLQGGFLLRAPLPRRVTFPNPWQTFTHLFEAKGGGASFGQARLGEEVTSGLGEPEGTKSLRWSGEKPGVLWDRVFRHNFRVPPQAEFLRCKHV